MTRGQANSNLNGSSLLTKPLWSKETSRYHTNIVHVYLHLSAVEFCGSNFHNKNRASLTNKVMFGNTGIKSFSFFCWTLCIVGQKVSSKSWMTAISLSPLREYCYYLVQSSNIRVKGVKMRRENNPISLPLETWCSLSVPQCAASNKGNWNSWCLYCRSQRFDV